MFKDLNGIFVCSSNVVNEYWITVKYSGIAVLKASPTAIFLY